MKHPKLDSLLSPFHLLLVEFELLALKNVSVTSSALAWARRDASQQSTGVELVGNLLVDDSSSASMLELSGHVSGSLGLGSGFVGLFDLLLVKLNIVVLQVPLPEGVGVDEHNTVLDDGLGSHELVVSGVVDDIQNSGLSGDGLSSPREVTMIKSQSTEFVISSSGSEGPNSGLAQFGGSWLSAHFELSLLLMNWHSATSGSSLVS